MKVRIRWDFGHSGGLLPGGLLAPGGSLVPVIKGVGSWPQPVRAGFAEGKAEGVSRVDDFFKVVAAGPAFFVSAWLLMLFAGDTGIRPFGYVMAMIVTIALWLTLAPAVGAIARDGKAKKS